MKFPTRPLMLYLALILWTVGVANAQPSQRVRERLPSSIAEDYGDVFDLYRYLPQHPELSFAETRINRQRRLERLAFR